MTPREWDRFKPLFDQALDLEPAERARFIERLRLDDEATAVTLSSLIDDADKTNSLDMPVVRLRDLIDGERCFAVGELVLNRFRIVRFLGRGGMGEVWEATDLHLGRVALKTIRAEVAASEQGLARFRREVRLARKIGHPNVCRIHDIFDVPARPGRRATSFLTMEYLAGMTLAERIENNGPLPLAEAESVALQVCAAVQSIHDAGIIHRDLKASNIMLVADPPKAVVMDLGLARETESDAGLGSGLTRANAVMGTPEYMAPEQFTGQAITPAADIYALGIVLYEIATGSRPFRAATPMGTAAMRGRRPPAASSLRPELPRRWDEVIDRCLEFDPERRFQSARAVAAAIEGRPFPALLLNFRQIRTAALIAAITVAVIGGGLWYRAHSYSRPSPDAQRWYDQGVAALREGTFYKATQALARAAALSPDFVLAHARLADAWAELDFTGKAKDEMLRASALQSRERLPELDARYLDAVRAALTYDYAASLRDYEAILKQLPEAEKAYGYVDLGRAQEKAGQVPEALKSYAEAARRAPEYPASFVHLGILDVRRGDDAAGNAAFAHAENLYRAASDVEGVADVAYERGYAASLKGDTAHAREFLQQSLRAAEDIPSAQLEIRSLVRLSTVEYLADRTDESIAMANRAIQLAREKGLDYWAADGLVRLGNAWLTKNDYAKAEPPLTEALRLAGEGQRPRLEANARLTLASIRSFQDKPDEAVALAQAALDYYRPAGFNLESTGALVLIGRAERDKANFKAALARALQALELARKSNNAASVMQVEELVGGILLELQNYPDALRHFQVALDAARSINQYVEYETVQSADALWRLGRYDEAAAMFASIPAAIARRPRMAMDIDTFNGYIFLSRLNPHAAIDIARRRLSDSSHMEPDTRVEFEIIAGTASTLSGMPAQAIAFCQMALAQAGKQANPGLTAEASLCLAKANLLAGSFQQALPLAESAQRFFAASGQTESLWRALLIIAKIQESMGNPDLVRKFSLEALDILRDAQHNWGDSAFGTYTQRPDIQAERRELIRLSGS